MTDFHEEVKARENSCQSHYLFRGNPGLWVVWATFSRKLLSIRCPLTGLCDFVALIISSFFMTWIFYVFLPFMHH